jgi:hypothetical protein
MSKIGEIAMYFLYVRDQLKIYHWTTETYSRHIASDSFVDKLTNNMDKFMEIIQGSENKRMVLTKKTKEISFDNENDKSIIKVLNDFSDWLINKLPAYLPKKNTDLINIRDDILGDVNNTLYLFTLK